MKRYYFLLLLSLLSLYSCQSLGLFTEQYYQEINTIIPNIKIKISDDIKKAISEHIKKIKIGKVHIIKTVNLSNIKETCSELFEIKLVENSILPASNHDLFHTYFGGSVINIGDTPKFVDLVTCQIGVAIKGSEPNTVYLLLYLFTFEFSMREINEEYNLNLSNEYEKEILNYMFYKIAYEVYIYELLPIKSQTHCIIK